MKPTCTDKRPTFHEQVASASRPHSHANSQERAA